MSYSLLRRELVGPRGVVTLPRQQSILAGLLFKHPGQRFPSERFITALWPDPDAEPDSADTIVRQQIGGLRQALAAVSSRRVEVTWERDYGYQIEERRR